MVDRVPLADRGGLAAPPQTEGPGTPPEAREPTADRAHPAVPVELAELPSTRVQETPPAAAAESAHLVDLTAETGGTAELRQWARGEGGTRWPVPGEMPGPLLSPMEGQVEMVETL